MPKGYSEEECLRAIKAAAEELDKAPTQYEYDDLGLSPSSKTISERVGSWGLALAKVGIEKEPRRETTKQRCLNAIRNLADDLGEEPTISDYKLAGYSPSLSSITVHCGSWTKAKEEAGVVDYGESSPSEEAKEFFDKLDDLGD